MLYIFKNVSLGYVPPMSSQVSCAPSPPPRPLVIWMKKWC